MADIVGVVDTRFLGPSNNLSLSALKQHALLFDRLAIPFLKLSILDSPTWQVQYPAALADARSLYEQGIVFDPQSDSLDIAGSEQAEAELDGLLQHSLAMAWAMTGGDPREMPDINIRELFTTMEPPTPEQIKSGVEEFMKAIVTNPEMIDSFEKTNEPPLSVLAPMALASGHQTRMFAAKLRDLDGINAFAILPESIQAAPSGVADKPETLRIVLNALPVPDDETPWQQILEWRADPDSRAKFLGLKNWANEVARAALTPNEVEEKLEYLMGQFRVHMAFHKIKADVGILETVITTSAEVLGDLVSAKWGAAAKALFALKKRKIELLEGELTAPGNEVAYVVKAQDTFN